MAHPPLVLHHQQLLLRRVLRLSCLWVLAMEKGVVAVAVPPPQQQRVCWLLQEEWETRAALVAAAVQQRLVVVAVVAQQPQVGQRVVGQLAAPLVVGRTAVRLLAALSWPRQRRHWPGES